MYDLPQPKFVIDLSPEYRLLANDGTKAPKGKFRLNAVCASYGIETISDDEKLSNQHLAQTARTLPAEDNERLLVYCQHDVEVTAELFRRMAPAIDYTRALIRGRYQLEVGRFELNGIPIDTRLFCEFVEKWEEIKLEFVEQLGPGYDGLFEGTTFKHRSFDSWLRRRRIPWPRTDTGRLSLKDQTFQEMALVYPEVNPIAETRYILEKLKLTELPIGSDGRHRLRGAFPFATKTGRNAPQGFIYGQAKWTRSFIRPEPGMALAYCDWAAQEFRIAAYLSRDGEMMHVATADDVYIAIASALGYAPSDATKTTHPGTRAMFKVVVLAINYGMGEQTLATRIGRSVIEARDILLRLRERFRGFFAWSQNAVDYAMSRGVIWTPLGWMMRPADTVRSRTLANFPVQGAGADIMRVSAIGLGEAGIRVCCPVHDAFLIEAPRDKIEEAATTTQRVMAAAVEGVLGAGCQIPTDVEIFRYPDRYVDDRGCEMWGRAQVALQRVRSRTQRVA